jgi:hypothetical protein
MMIYLEVIGCISFLTRWWLGDMCGMAIMGFHLAKNMRDNIMKSPDKELISRIRPTLFRNVTSMVGKLCQGLSHRGE